MSNAGTVYAELEMVRARSPLVHNITNYVVMNFTANALLAVGASPVMAHALEEVEDMVGIAGSLVINMGTLSRPWVESMLKAMKAARTKGIPVVFDPVGVGATAYRNEVAQMLLHEGKPTMIRGNASEIMALQKTAVKTKGVDSTQSSSSAISSAMALANQTGAVVCVSGAIDFVVAREGIAQIQNGDAMMTKVTGMGCSATAILGAFAAVGESPFISAQAALATVALAGERAAKQSHGPGSLALNYLDQLYGIRMADFERGLKLEQQ